MEQLFYAVTTLTLIVYLTTAAVYVVFCYTLSTVSFRPYRFSLMSSKQDLMNAIERIHFACHALSMNSFGHYLPVAGNVGVFCHYDEEFETLKQIRDTITKPNTNLDLKYYELFEPIEIPAKDSVPATTYTHLYIRKPDPYRYQTGDIDFRMTENDYKSLKSRLENGRSLPGARVFERPELDMVESYNPAIDALGYVSTSTMTEKVRIKL